MLEGSGVTKENVANAEREAIGDQEETAVRRGEVYREIGDPLARQGLFIHLVLMAPLAPLAPLALLEWIVFQIPTLV